MGRRPHIRVTLYSSPTCPYCSVARRYLLENAIDFAEVDVSIDREGRREMIVMTGQRGVPVVLVGEKAMVGWNEAEFERLRTPASPSR